MHVEYMYKNKTGTSCSGQLFTQAHSEIEIIYLGNHGIIWGNKGFTYSQSLMAFETSTV